MQQKENSIIHRHSTTPCRKKQQRTDNSLEERIRRLTCDVDETTSTASATNASESGSDSAATTTADTFSMDTMERRDSPAGEENPPQPAGQTGNGKYGMLDKSFSPSSSASSSSSGSTSTSAYRKITDIFNRDRRQERIPEADESPIVIIPQVSGDEA